MTILLWILGILAVPVLLFGLWLAGVFLKEFFSPSPDDDDDADDGVRAAEAAAALGLLPSDRQDTAYAGPLPADWRAALDAVRADDWRPAADLLAAIGRDWEGRAAFSYALSQLAVREDDWLLAWEAERADDPDAALVRARSTVGLAWEIRGARRATYTTGEQFEGFHRTLRTAREQVARAAALHPDDPTPYIAETWIALGLGYPNSAMDKLWSEITARAPHHFEAHFAALQYWCAKWSGSERLATAFAERAAAQAPPGSLLTAFPLIAHFEHDESADTEADSTPEMIARVDAALVDAAAADPAHPRLPELRHLLAFYLSLQGREEAALEQFRLVDGHVNALPWRYRVDRAGYYCQVRDATVVAARATHGTPPA
ncbi:hypothetical protein ABZ439_06050 [Streptomyces sp. NPDC005840]|uniref:hypothetical protein n=1 Tax=Streptomyces sp. NPDC005840 TaxID=3157072 RepID=UPI0033D1A131